MPVSDQILGLIITNIAAIVLAIVALARTRENRLGKSDETKAALIKQREQDEADARRREDERMQRQFDTLVAMSEGYKEQAKQIGRLVDNLERQREDSLTDKNVLAKVTNEVHDQGDTLDTVQALLIGQNKKQDEQRQEIIEHRKETKPAIDAIQSVPEKLSGVKDELASVRSDLKDLPTAIKDEMKPALDKLDSIENEVKRLEKVVQDMRTELLTAVHAALAHPVPPTPVVVPVAEKPA